MHFNLVSARMNMIKISKKHYKIVIPKIKIKEKSNTSRIKTSIQMRSSIHTEHMITHLDPILKTKKVHKLEINLLMMKANTFIIKNFKVQTNLNHSQSSSLKSKISSNQHNSNPFWIKTDLFRDCTISSR